MDSNQLLDRLKDRDMEAFHHLTERYGWKLYSYLKTRFRDKEQVDAAMNATLHQFYNAVAGSDDPIEALLFSFADRTCQNMTDGQSIPSVESPAMRSDRKGENIFFLVAFIVLVIGIFLALWVIIGLLMGLGIMPEVDFGYSWFNEHIFPWF